MAYDDRRPGESRDPRGPVPSRRNGWGAGWWIVFFVVIAFIIWAVAWSWGGWGGYRNRAAAPVTPATTAAGTTQGAEAAPQVSVAQLSGPGQNGQQYLNQNVRVDDVQMVARAGNQAFWVRGASGARLLVVANQNGNAMPQSDQASNGTSPDNRQVQQGEILSILGSVQQVNSSNQLQQQYGVESQAASQLKPGETFLLAQQVYPQGQNPDQSQGNNRGQGQDHMQKQNQGH